MSLIVYFLLIVVKLLSWDFIVRDEILGRWRPPNVKRIRRWVIGSEPVEIVRYEVNTARIFGIAAPRIAYVVEVIGAEHMTTEAPALSPPGFAHLLCPLTDVIDACHVPTAVMQTGCVRFGEGDKVVIAAVGRVNEGDAVA